MIETSLRVYKYGWLSLLPLIGTGFAMATLWLFIRVFYFTRDEWNPARSYLYWGAGVALASGLLHGVAIAIPLAQLALAR